MLGNNPKRSPFQGSGADLQIKKIFCTIQGEGVYAGYPAIFVRCGGCNLACKFCDTEFENFSDMNVDDIINQIDLLSTQSAKSNVIFDSTTIERKLDNEQKNHYNKRNRVVDLVVITGGEPMRQPINLLCQKLIDNNFTVQIETNGTLYTPLPTNVEVICSPKIINGRYLKIIPEIIPYLSGVKFLISKTLKGYDNIDNIHEVIKYIQSFQFKSFKSQSQIAIFLQPIDQFNEILNQQNKQFATMLALKYGYRLSYQIHKELNIE